jgi:hypothetical protein
MIWTDYTDDAARGALRAWIGEALSDANAAEEIEDYRLDLILEAARRRDLQPPTVRLWIFDDMPRHGWSPGALVQWACAHGFMLARGEGEGEGERTAAAAPWGRHS